MNESMEPAGSGATWTGSPKGVFTGAKTSSAIARDFLSLVTVFGVGCIGWLDHADFSDQCLAKKFTVACPHLSGSSIHIS
jgi:hypothetical protein